MDTHNKVFFLCEKHIYIIQKKINIKNYNKVKKNVKKFSSSWRKIII